MVVMQLLAMVVVHRLLCRAVCKVGGRCSRQACCVLHTCAPRASLQV